MPLQQRLQDWLDSRCSRHLIGCSRSGNTLAPTGSSCSSLLPNHLKPKQRLQQKDFIRLLTSRVDSHSATWLHLKADKHMTPKHTKNKLNNTSIIQSFLLRFQPRTMHKSVIFCKAIRSSVAGAPIISSRRSERKACAVVFNSCVEQKHGQGFIKWLAGAVMFRSDSRSD